VKKILIIADGITANRFIQRIVQTDTTNNRYYIVYYNDKTLCDKNAERFFYFKFDPTSFSKLSSLVETEEFHQSMVIVANKIDMIESYNNIRKIDKNLPISLVDRWDIEFNDKNLIIIDAHDTISNIFSNYLPDFPLFAQNLGIGTGEIMEFKIPFASPYVYRHVRNIDQNRWRIAAIFREHKLILPTPSLMLLPNDSLLVVGNPNVLKGVYKSIKREFGQFPIPYGESIYCFIDMAILSDDDIEILINDAMILHSKLNNNRLFFKIVNARFSPSLEKIKSYANTNMIVEFNYYEDDFKSIVFEDIARLHVGLLVTNQKFLELHLEAFYACKLPIFKIAKGGFFTIKESVFLGSDSKKAEKISSTIFDISTQLKIDITLFKMDLEDSEDAEKIIDHFQNLSKLFNEKVHVIHTKENPIRQLSKRDDFLQFVIFDQKMFSSKLQSFLSTDIEKHYFRFKNNYQLFIPSQ
jgi:hypothetical protein